MSKLRRPPSPPRMPTKPRSKPIPAAKSTARRAGSNVQGHEYSPETGHLTVTFHGGRQYRYSGVSKEIAERFRDSSSQGSFLHSHIIGKFDATKI